MLKSLEATRLDEMKNKTFDIVRITERLCEFCDEPIDRKEKLVRKIHISDRDDYEKLLNRAKIYDRAEVDLKNEKIYFYDHDYPGDVHPSCVQKL